jgi:hypothetical protein
MGPALLPRGVALDDQERRLEGAGNQVLDPRGRARGERMAPGLQLPGVNLKTGKA